MFSLRPPASLITQPGLPLEPLPAIPSPVVGRSSSPPGRMADRDLLSFSRSATAKRGVVAKTEAPITELPDISLLCQDVPVPLLSDPRALILPVLDVQDGHPVFIAGYDPQTRLLSRIHAVSDASGEICLEEQLMDPATGQVVRTHLLNNIFRDDHTGSGFFSSSPFETSVVFELVPDPQRPGGTVLKRYPSYSAAGLKPPLITSTVWSTEVETIYGITCGSDKKEHYLAAVFASPDQKIEIVIIEDEQGRVCKVMDRHYRWEYPISPDHFGGNPVYRIAPDLGILLTRVPTENGFRYQVDVFHNLDEDIPFESPGQRLDAITLLPQNALWPNAVNAHVERLKTDMRANYDRNALLQSLCTIRDAEGMDMVHEVIMALYFDEKTQMLVVDSLKHAQNLPLPLDTRIIPATTEHLYFLFDFLSQNGAHGMMSTILKNRVGQITHLPQKFIVGLWLSLKRQTLAEKKFFNKGADTPDSLGSSPPVMAATRIQEEKTTPLDNSTAAARSAQRDRIRRMTGSDALDISFRHYLGEQLRLADAYDLLIMDSGSLYLDDIRVQPLEESKDALVLHAADPEGKIREIRKDRTGDNPFAQPLVISEKDFAPHREMFDTHPADRFRYLWTGKTDSPEFDIGTFDNGMMLIRDGETRRYRRPAPTEVADSLAGLLTLPANYLDQFQPLSSVNPGSFQSPTEYTYEKGTAISFNSAKRGYQFAPVMEGVSYKTVQMIPYHIKTSDFTLDLCLPDKNSYTARIMVKNGYYAAGEEDIPQILKYYSLLARRGYLPDHTKLYLLPGMLLADDTTILGYFDLKDESIVLSSVKVKTIDELIAATFFYTLRHEMAHAIHRNNPWISSMVYRCMALDGFNTHLGATNINEYWAYLVQNFFDHPQNRYRFPNGYRLVYTLIKLREQGVVWDGPDHRLIGDEEDVPDEYDADDDDARNIDGTRGALRALATGRNPFHSIRP